jgi:chromosome segregation ATPase
VDAKADYDALLESSTVVTNKLREEVRELRSQLETEKTRGEEIWEELSDTEQVLAEVRSENSELKKNCDELRSQFEQEHVDREEAEARLADREKQIEELRSELFGREKTIVAQRDKIQNLERGYGFEETPTEKILRRQIRDLEQQLSDLKQKSAAASKDLPEAADILNQLKSKRKKSKTDLADLEVILEILES